MKKQILSVILSLFVCPTIFALPIGNPADASLYSNSAIWGRDCDNSCDPRPSFCDFWSIRLGYYRDDIFDRHLKVHDDGHIDRTHMLTNAGSITLNLFDRLDVFTTLGATNIAIRTDAAVFTDVRTLFGEPSQASDLFFQTDFSWSIGARATLWECNCFILGIEGQYFRTNPNVTSFDEYFDGTITYIDRQVHYREWQVGLGCAYRFAIGCPDIAFVPYAGAKYSRARLNMNDITFVTPVDVTPIVLHDLRSANHWGGAVGISLILADAIGVSAEYRFGDESAVAFTGELRF